MLRQYFTGARIDSLRETLDNFQGGHSAMVGSCKLAVALCHGRGRILQRGSLFRLETGFCATPNDHSEGNSYRQHYAGAGEIIRGGCCRPP